MARWSRFIFSRVAAVVTLVVAMLLLAMPAAAEVVANERYTFVIVNPNPCAPEDGVITLNFEEHDVVQQLADGTLLVHSNIHGTGTSTNGTEYVVNRHQVTMAATPAFEHTSATFRVVRISKGSGDNVHIEGTFTFDVNRTPPLIVMTSFRCVG